MFRPRLIFILSLLTGAGIADRWLKVLAIHGATADWWFAHFVVFKNDRLVFSWPLSNTIGTVLMAAAMIIVAWVFWRAWRRRQMQMFLGASLMFLGAASNLFDRLRYGFVIDWAYLGQWWPVFNLADVMIAGGLVLLLVSGKKKSRQSES